MLTSLVPWSVEETALLIDLYQRVKNSESQRQKAIHNMSDILCNYAISRNNQIDGTYRSYVNIYVHFLEIQRIFEQDLGKVSNANPLFVCMVKMYKINRFAFEEILQRSKIKYGIINKIDEDSSEQANVNFDKFLNLYFGHLKQTNTLDDFKTNVYADLRTLEKYFKKTNVINQSLFNIKDKGLIVKINSIVERSKLFKILNKTKYEDLLGSWHIFYKYVESGYDDGNESEIEPENELDNNSQIDNDTNISFDNNEQTKEELKDKVADGLSPHLTMVYNDDSEKQEFSNRNNELETNNTNIKSFSFDQIPDLTFTKVKSYKLFEYEEKVTLWNTFYVSVVRDLCKEHLSIIKQLVNKSITNANRIDFGNDKSYLSMSAPKYIKQDLYVETKLDANTIAKKLQRLLDICGISRNELTVYYFSENKEENLLKINNNKIATIDNAGIKAKKIPWSEEETALLIETYQNIVSGKIKRSDAIKELSEILRNYAIKKGIRIDNIFRNTNGITMRLLEIQYLFEKTGGFYKTSALYSRMVEMYKYNRNSFDKILQRSHIEFGIKSIKPDLEPEPEHLQPTSKYKPSIDLVNNSTEKRLFDRFPLIYKRIFDFLKEMLGSNKWFSVNEIYDAINKIARPADIEEIVDNVSWVLNLGNKYRFASNSKTIPNPVVNSPGVGEPKTGFIINYNENVVDFNNMQEYQFTKPISCFCFGENLIVGNTWAKLYVAVISKIYFKFQDYFIPGMSFSDKNGSRMDFCNKFRVHQMVRPVEIENTFLYLESNLSARDIIRKIKYVLDLCNIDYNDVEIKYSSSESNPLIQSPVSIPLPKLIAKKPLSNPNYKKVLEEKFPHGFKLNSGVNIRKFKAYYLELNGLSLDNVNESLIKKEISSCGIEYNEKLYVPDKILPIEAKTKLLNHINKSFNDGKTEIYYEALFNEFNEEFLDYDLLDASMLKLYLDFINEGNYYIKKDYISKDSVASINPYDEIKKLLIESSEPVLVSDINKKLSHLPTEIIKNTLAFNSEFVRNAKGVYFHADSLYLNSEELETIANYIENTINSQNYITGNEIYKFIEEKLPSTFADKISFSSLGWRDALKYKLKERFDFKGNIISHRGETLSTTDIFSIFAKSKNEFTIDNLISFSDELDTNLNSYYFDAIYKFALRINQNKFVNKNQVHFDIEATDKAIDRFFNGKYIPIKEINEFGSFPDASFPWTDFMLEQFADQYSEKFKLIHSGYNRNSIAGAIVRKEANLTELDDLVIDILVSQDLPLNQNDILNYLVQKGYIVTKSYKNINALILKANSIRNMKRKN